MIALLASLVLAKPFSFYALGPYTNKVPRPDDILGYQIGTTHSTFRDQERVVLQIAKDCPSTVKEFQYGKSVEGRPLRVFAVSTPENIRRLEEIRKNHALIASGKPEDQQRVIKDTPPIIWINECIHGDETASFESAMPLLYNLATSTVLQKELKDAIVIVNPVYNPDGHERYVVYYNSIATGSDQDAAFENQEPALIFGRLNHYRFDMNRDRVAMSQEETRQEVAEFLRWNPQVYCDQHGQVNSYFFPPNPMSVNENVDRDRVAKWTEVFGRAAGKAFDSQGWTYYVKNEFDLFYAGYLDSWTTLTGAIGMTHETDGGRVLNETRDDGSHLSLRDGIAHHFTAALAVIGSAAAHHEDLMSSYANFKRKAASGEFSPSVKRYVMAGEQRELVRLRELLSRSGIKSTYLSDWKQPGAKKFGSAVSETVNLAGPVLIVDLDQPQGPMAKAMLEPQAGYESKFIREQLAKKTSAPEGESYPGQDGTEFYDFTGWSLPYAFGLTAYECSVTTKLAPEESLYWSTLQGNPSVGYVLRYTDQEDALAAAEILSRGVHGMVASRSMSVGSLRIGRGDFMFLSARNEDGYHKIVGEIAKLHQAALEEIPTSYPDSDRWGPGAEGMIPLKKPNIGIVFGTADQPTNFAGIWYLMDRVFHLPFTPLNSRSMTAGVLAKYTTIVIPGRFTGSTDALKAWVQEGGTLVSLGGAGWASSTFQKLDEVEGEFRDLPGGLFRAQLDPRSFLSFGYQAPEKGKIEIAVPVEGNTFYKAKKEGGSVVTFDPDEKSRKLLSGWDWPEETDKALANTVWLQDEPTGRGHVIIFTHDPADRAMWPGLNKMLLNAMLIGPGARS